MRQKCKVNIKEKNVFKGDIGDKKDECNAKSNFFIQYACVFPPEQRMTREICGLLLASIGILVYCFTIIYLDYIRAVEKNMFVDFDVQTVTAGDYTIEFDLKKDTYEYFK